LERCVNQLGFIGCNLNPDPSGGNWTAPPLTDKYWYPFYEKMVELDVPAMVHVSATCNPNFHTTGSHYINADTTAFMQFMMSDVFQDFLSLSVIMHDVERLQGLPRPEVHHSPWRRRHSVPLGPLSRSGAGQQAAAAGRADEEQH